ncbi:(Fe-S)-binding protein [Pinisolibacter sp.]|uniref:(Fe-S)-binding protein n=1 Tax=Pinisolibacter sp. TaxID=2172024 RepID=UPI002FDEC94E
MSAAASASRPKVALFVTCLVDLFRPTVGFAAVKLIEDAGCEVVVPAAQTCCGQPAFNSGDRKDAAMLAKKVIETFEGYDHLVAPSGSCAGHIATHYVELFDDGDPWKARAERLAAKSHELVSFLVDVLGVTATGAKFAGTVTYHDSCSGLRELGVKDQPRKLLSAVDGLTLTEMKDPDVCCGFGGAFSVKYPDLSGAIVDKKTDNITDAGASTLLAGDMGCLMNMAGRLSRKGSKVEVRHVAEVLAGMADGPAIGATKKGA